MKKTGIILLILLTILVFWKFFAPGPRVANDYPYVFPDLLKTSFNIPSTWQNSGGEGMGENGILTMWSWPTSFLFGLSGMIGISFDVSERLFLFLIIFLGVFSVSKLLKKYEIRNSGIFVATIFYLITTYFILLIDGGQLLIALAYSFFPLSFIWIEDSIDGSLKRKILAGVGVSILGFCDIRFVYVLFILSTIRFFYEFVFLPKSKRFLWIRNVVKTGSLVILVFLGLHFYWILPLILARGSSLSTNFTRLTQSTSLNFTSLGHAMSMLQPHWYKNVFGKITPLKPEFILIPILVFLAPVLRRKNKNIGFWLIVAVTGIFLVKGANPPFGYVYTWLFENIPGFSLFRDSTKFFFLIAISYSVLIGVTVDELTKRFNWSFSISHLSLKAIPLLPASYLLLLTLPVWTNQMTGTFSDPIYKEEFLKVVNVLKDDKNFGRIFWIPSRAPLGFVSPNHLSAEASRFFTKRPFAIGNVGTYEIYNFLRESPFMGELFGIAGIKYIEYPFPDTRREVLRQDNINYYYAFLDQLTNLSWVKAKFNDPPVPVLEIKESKDRFFLIPNTFIVIGSDGIYWDLMQIPGFDLSKNAFYFNEENSGIIGDLKNIPIKNIILYDKTETDLAASFMNSSSLYFPALSLNVNPTKENPWWKRETTDFLWWRNFLQQKYKIDNLDFDYGGGWAVAEGTQKLQITHSTSSGQTNDKFNKGEILLARVMKSSRGGKVSFYQGDELIGEITTKIENPQKVQVKLTGYKETSDEVFEYDKADFNWYQVGKFVSSDPLEIITEGDINVINAISSLSEEEWNHLNRLTLSYNVIDWEKLTESDIKRLFNSSDQPKITYKYITPTKYKVKVEGLDGSATLAFSETYDSLWQANGKSSYPIYSLINGFRIDKDGDYEIYFSPQKYVAPGLVISALTLTSVIFLFILMKKKPRPV